MIFEIAIHILPQEIDDLTQTLISLKRSSFYLSKDDKVKVSVALNFNLTDWSSSKLPKEYFINKFNHLESLTQSWARTNFFIPGDDILGNFSFHRTLYNETDSDYIINLDTDIIFSETLLANIINSSKLLDKEYLIITPEISKLWDNSWDVIVNKQYLNLPPSQDYITNDPYTNVINNEGCYLEELKTFKFGMGWFTLFNKNLIDLIELPSSMGHYGPDDTFIMTCAEICKNKGFNISQFVLRNEIIRENILYKPKTYNNLLFTINKKDEFREIAQNNFYPEVQKFNQNTKT